MIVIFQVDRRDAISVRAIPYVTGWTMSPDKVAAVMAHTDPITKMRAVGSYQLDGSGRPRKTLPKDWDQYVAGMEALAARLKASQSHEAISFEEWLRLSNELLPAGVFVWKDEFEPAFNSTHSRERLTILHEREGDRELNFFRLFSTRLKPRSWKGLTGFQSPIPVLMTMRLQPTPMLPKPKSWVPKSESVCF